MVRDEWRERAGEEWWGVGLRVFSRTLKAECLSFILRKETSDRFVFNG